MVGFAVFETISGRVSGTAYKGSLYAICTQCLDGVIFFLTSRGKNNVNGAHNVTGDAFKDAFTIDRVFPEPPTIEVVEFLEPEISETYLEAEGNYSDARYRSAAAMYRTTVELSVKHLDPKGKGSLYSRIEALSKANALPPTLIALMHEVRFLGNDSVHAKIDPEDVQRGREFIKLFLVYVFELPKKIELAAEKRNGLEP